MAKVGDRVVVTTEHRGVFFGRLTEDKAPECLILSDSRQCVYWDSSIRGVLGLAANGPGPLCRIGPNVPSITVWKITGIFVCTDEATRAWGAGPWN